MNAAAIVELADGPDGIGAVMARFGCTRHDAEIVVTRACIRLREDSKAARPPMPGRAVTDAELRTLPGAYVDPSEHTYEAQAAKRRRYTLEKNVANGYREWEYELGRMNSAS